LIELKKTIFRLKDGDPDIKPLEDRLKELSGESDDIDEMLAEIEARVFEREHNEVKGQLELFGVMLNTLVDQKDDDLQSIDRLIAGEDEKDEDEQTS
jgi:hypothetical protein